MIKVLTFLSFLIGTCRATLNLPVPMAMPMPPMIAPAVPPLPHFLHAHHTFHHVPNHDFPRHKFPKHTNRRLLQTGSYTINLVNQCDYNVMPGIIAGQLDANSQPYQGGIGNIPPHTSTAIQLDSSMKALNIWPRMDCNDDGSGCTSGGCSGDGSGDMVHCKKTGGSNPKTQVEFTFNGDGGNDFYDVSLVNGFNIPVSVAPANSGCHTIGGCDLRQVAGLPDQLYKRDTNGYVYNVNALCDVNGDANSCCPAPMTPDQCHLIWRDPSTVQGQVYAVENQVCSEQYLYAYDDVKATYTCQNGGANTGYTITFCG